MIIVIWWVILFVAGMKTQKRFAPKFVITDHAITLEYKGQYGDRITKKLF